MRRILVVVAALAACGGSDEEHDLTGEWVSQNDAADEALGAMADTLEQFGATVSPRAADWIAPDDGATLDRAAPPTFEWTPKGTASLARHLKTTGHFVWLRLETPGDDVPMDVISIEDGEAQPTSFTPTAAQWARISAGGSITARLVTAELDHARVVEGPFEAADSARTFTIGP